MATSLRVVCFFLATFFYESATSNIFAADAMASLELRQVKVGGEIGRRIERTINNNVLVVDIEKDFLRPFRARSANDGFVGLGMFVDSVVRFAAYNQDAKLIAFKKHLIDEMIGNQQPDGYIGLCAPAARMTGLWDIHEMGYVVFALTNDYRLFGDKRSLDAARKLADYIVSNWRKLPADWGRQTTIATDVAVTGIERALLTLHGQTQEPRYLDFCVQQRNCPIGTWVS